MYLLLDQLIIGVLEASEAAQPSMQLGITNLTTRCHNVLGRCSLGVRVHSVGNAEVGARAEINAAIGGNPCVLAVGFLELGRLRLSRAETGPTHSTSDQDCGWR